MFVNIIKKAQITFGTVEGSDFPRFPVVD